MSYAENRKRLADLVGPMPVFTGSRLAAGKSVPVAPGDAFGQVLGWIRWSERKKLLDNFDVKQRELDEAAKAQGQG